MDWQAQERLCRKCFRKEKRVFTSTESLSLDDGFCPLLDDVSVPVKSLSEKEKSALRACNITNNNVVDAQSRVAAFMINA